MENRKGIILLSLSMLGFAIADGFTKGAVGSINSQQIILGIGVIGTIAFAITCLMKSQNPFPKTFFHPAVIARNLGEMLGSFGIITSISLIDISTTSAIQQATPLAVCLGAVILFGETVGWRRWCAIILGFASVLLIIRPGFEGFEKNAIFAVFGVIGLSIRDLATRRVPPSVSSLQLSVFGYLILIPLGLAITLPFGIAPVVFTSDAFFYLAMISLFSMIAYITITIALRMGQISVIAPFRYSRLLFALIIGIVFFDENPDWQTILGAIGIMISGVFLLMREGQLKRAK